MLAVSDLEQVYSELAEGIDAVGRDNEGLLLTKLALALANEAGDVGTFRAAMTLARRELDPADATPATALPNVHPTAPSNVHPTAPSNGRPTEHPIANQMANPIDIAGLHHFAWRCRDAEETRAFYEDLLGLPLAHVIKADTVPSTGEHCPYVHIFFRMRDGSYIAFFDLGDNTTADPSPNTPSWVNHIALELDSVDDVVAAKRRLQAAGVEVLGVTDHHIIQSIYFFDPNGLRVELTAKSVPDAYMDRAELQARADLDAWTATKTPADRPPLMPQRPQGAAA